MSLYIENSQLNKFKTKLYDEFEDNCFKVLGVPSSRVREVFSQHNDDIDAEFEAAWKFGGAAFMRQTMSMKLVTLEMVYYETEIGRQLTQEEQAKLTVTMQRQYKDFCIALKQLTFNQ